MKITIQQEPITGDWLISVGRAFEPGEGINRYRAPTAGLALLIVKELIEQGERA